MGNSSPYALFIDSGGGWLVDRYNSFILLNKPEFTLRSKGDLIQTLNGNSENEYRGNPIIELQRFIADGYTAAGYISYDYTKNTNEKFHPEIKKDYLNWYDTYFHFYKKENVVTGALPDVEKDLNIYGRKFGASNFKHISNFDKDSYKEMVKCAKSYIEKGDIYQVNLSQMYTTGKAENPVCTFLNFYNAQPVPFSAFIGFNEYEFISGSMELFLKKTGKRILTKPIKGTAKRGKDTAQDDKIRKMLRNSGKEKAENLMIVDLMRNDLGRICIPGTVVVNELFRINEYKTLFQMESEIEGTLDDGISLDDIINNTFPPGSVTGTPKSRALEIINELEPHSRGPYCGAFGIFYPNFDFTLSVAIRIMVLDHSSTRYWVGGGIVWDSDPEAEYEETLLKAKAIKSSLN